MDFSRFDHGVLHEDQRQGSALEITDINGERWGYIRVREAMKFGQVVRSSKHADLVTTDPGAVSAAAPAGSSRLTTDNGFQLGRRRRQEPAWRTRLYFGRCGYRAAVLRSRKTPTMWRQSLS